MSAERSSAFPPNHQWTSAAPFICLFFRCILITDINLILFSNVVVRVRHKTKPHGKSTNRGFKAAAISWRLGPVCAALAMNLPPLCVTTYTQAPESGIATTRYPPDASPILCLATLSILASEAEAANPTRTLECMVSHITSSFLLLIKRCLLLAFETCKVQGSSPASVKEPGKPAVSTLKAAAMGRSPSLLSQGKVFCRQCC
jgi:hypothetical protein